MIKIDSSAFYGIALAFLIGELLGLLRDSWHLPEIMISIDDKD